MKNLKANQDADTKKEFKTPAYYHHDHWQKWSGMYDNVVKLSFIPFGGEGRFRRNVVRFGEVKEGERILDLCCGTGSLTAVIASRVGKIGSVTAVDLSADMINKARLKTRGLPVTFRQASADALPFKEDTFGKAFISYGMHEMPEDVRRKAIGELFRVVKAGSNLYVVDYNLPSNPITRLGIGTFLRVFEEDAAYRLAKEGTLAKELSEAGFKAEERKLLIGGMFQIIRARKP
jgi:ubiquinone/menaquinone biosynthesis C-methylase UbiE